LAKIKKLKAYNKKLFKDNYHTFFYLAFAKRALRSFPKRFHPMINSIIHRLKQRLISKSHKSMEFRAGIARAIDIHSVIFNLPFSVDVTIVGNVLKSFIFVNNLNKSKIISLIK